MGDAPGPPSAIGGNVPSVEAVGDPTYPSCGSGTPRVVFLLGSGISLDAGMPKVQDITERVMSGEGAWRHTSGVFCFGADQPDYGNGRPVVERVLKLLALLNDAIGSDPSVRPTYEDVAYAVQQLRDAISGEYENPLVLPLARELEAALRVTRGELGSLCAHAADYIADTVAEALTRGRLHDHAHLRAIIGACQQFEAVDLATLNHDLLLDAALTAAGVDVGDGFERTKGDVRFWTDNWGTGRIRLLKLHGSIDWFRFSDERGDQKMGRYLGSDVEHPRRTGVELLSPRPAFLAGTFTKILGYQTGVFPAVHTRFHEGLREAARVVVTGYGFRDKAINAHLINWIERDRSNRLIVCHKNPDELLDSARGAVEKSWRRYVSGDRLRVLPVFVRDLTFEALAAALAAG